MNASFHITLLATAVALCACKPDTGARAVNVRSPAGAWAPDKTSPAVTTPVTDLSTKPKPREVAAKLNRSVKALSPRVDKALDYIVSQQHSSGGWGQGGGWRQGKGGGRTDPSANGETADVGNTSVATLALLRAGHTPKRGKYKTNVATGVEFICKSVDTQPRDSLAVSSVAGTQIQSKIGRHVDTFLAAMMLAEAKGEMGNAAAEKRLSDCLDTVIYKIEKNQREDGTFEGNRGWASVLSQGISSKGMYRAKQRGAKVSEKSLARFQKQAVDSFDSKTGAFKSGAGASDAGVGIYGTSAGLATLQESVNTSAQTENEANDILGDKNASKTQKDEARTMLGRVAEARQLNKEAKTKVVERLADQRFISGFGSNGGEEFLSYMNISESLLVEGGPEWEAWDKSMVRNLEHVQNKDGSWAGHHCITGRTFVTSTALLVLLADRAPVSTSAKIRGG